MHELKLVELLRAEVPPPTDLTAAETRFRAGMAELKASPPRRMLRPRLFLTMPRAVLAAGLAAALAASVILVDRVGGDGNRAGSTRIVPVSAVEVLYRAAKGARREPAARPDQFLYSKIKYTETPVGAHEVSEVWESANGQRDGLSIENGKRKRVPFTETDRWPPSTYVKQAKLPTDANALLKFLDVDPEQPNELLNQLDTLMSPTGPPKLRAAVFQATARQPGVKVLPDVVDAIGRHGVAVIWQPRDFFSGNVLSDPAEWIFEPRTYRLLATRYPLAMCALGYQKSAQGTCENTILSTGVVDRVGQRP